MNGDDDIRNMFDRLEFRGEPPMDSMAANDVHRGRRRLRAHRAVAWTSGLAGVAVLGAGVAVALPGGGAEPARELGVAGSDPTMTGNPMTGAPTPAPEPESESGTPTPAPDRGLDLPFPETRQLLLSTAADHFDPAGVHLPDETTNAQSGGSRNSWSVGSKLDWVVPGDDGLGMIQVAVTTPGYVDEEYARSDFGSGLGCDVGTESCPERPIPGTDQTAWVAESSETDEHQMFSVVHERADGSMVGVRVSTLFGNNSLVPVPSVDIDLDQAFGFVTDHDLTVDPQEAELERSDVFERPVLREGALPSPMAEQTPGAAETSGSD